MSAKKRLGRPLASEGDPTQRKTITLRRSTWERLEGERQARESLSSCIDRLLSAKQIRR